MTTLQTNLLSQCPSSNLLSRARASAAQVLRAGYRFGRRGTHRAMLAVRNAGIHGARGLVGLVGFYLFI